MTTAPMQYLATVTMCVDGVAHIYMAVERLERLCQQEKWNIKIETQGVLGIESRLTEEDINHADVMLLITDIELAGAERSTWGRYVQSGTSALLRESQRVMDTMQKLLSTPQHIHLTLDQSLSPSTGYGTADGILMMSIPYSCETGGRNGCCQQTHKCAPSL